MRDQNAPWTGPSDYASAKRLYDSIPPVVSVLHKKEDDVRPYGTRGKKNNRIAKYTDEYGDFYVLYGGYTCADPIFDAYMWNRDRRGHMKPCAVAPAALKRYAPAAWWREGDREFFSIRAPESHSNGWIDFAEWVVPVGLRIAHGGTHPRDLCVGHKKYRFAGRAAYPPAIQDHLEAQITTRSYWIDRRSGDPAPYVFERHKDGIFTPVEIPAHANTITRKRIDKGAKREHAEGIKKFKDWVWAIGPMWGFEIDQPWDILNKMVERDGVRVLHRMDAETKAIIRGALDIPGAMQVCFMAWREISDSPRRYDPMQRVWVPGPRPSKEEMTSRLNKYVNDKGGFIIDVEVERPE